MKIVPLCGINDCLHTLLKNPQQLLSLCFDSLLNCSLESYDMLCILLPAITWEGALHERPVSSLMRAAAVGLLELMRTGGLISIEWRFWEDWEALLDMVREVNEWRFLVFFLVSMCFWTELPWDAPEVPSPESVAELEGLSNSISCFAVVLNCKTITQVYKYKNFD